MAWSDHWSLSTEGYAAIKVTGTATFRNPFCHTSADKIDTLDCGTMSREMEGLEAVIEDIASDR